MKRIAIFASGEGSNAEAIVKYFINKENIEVSLVLTNRCNAGVTNRLLPYGIKINYFTKQQWDDAVEVLELLNAYKIDLIVLAGFLAIIRKPIINAYEGKIINIHPSLLPRHGGSGMWGIHVHRSVIASGDKHSGITIHYVNEDVDGGKIIAQYKCDVGKDDTPELLAERVHQLEYRYFPQEIEKVLLRK